MYYHLYLKILYSPSHPSRPFRFHFIFIFGKKKRARNTHIHTLSHTCLFNSISKCAHMYPGNVSKYDLHDINEFRRQANGAIHCTYDICYSHFPHNGNVVEYACVRCVLTIKHN